jgi:RND family efflux transporter MFP subunit
MAAKVDLRQLAVRRDDIPCAPSITRGRHRRLLTRFVLPTLLLAGFATLLAAAAWERLRSPRPVTVLPVILSRAEMEQPGGTPMFRAAGWVEPRPTPIVVTSLAEGVVEQLLVVEGQEVQQGQTVARLVAADARLALEAAEADVDLRQSELASAKATCTAARARRDLPVHLQAELADAQTALAKAESELVILPNLLAAAQARCEYAEQEYAAERRSGDAATRISLAKALSNRDSADASLKELQARQKRLPVEIAALRTKSAAQTEKLARLVDEVRQVEEGEAAVKSARARLRQALAARDTALLRLERMEIKAPVSGRVLALVARPGTRLTGLAVSSLHDSSTVVTLYDPRSLQVRVDVRLDDVAKALPGQKVKIETAALPGASLDGEVLRATSQADIQKNTLSVKVAITDPPPTLKTDMLCQVTFLALPRPARPGKEGEPYRVLVPRELVASSGGSSRIWVADLVSGMAKVRQVEVGLTSGELVEVVSGLGTTDRLIVGGRDGLQEGDPIVVVGEDEALGIKHAGASKRSLGK